MPSYGILPADEGAGLLPWSWAVERLSAARNYWLTSVRPDGRPHVQAVWGVWLGNLFLYSTSETSRKARNLALNSACAIAIECGVNETVVVEGTAYQEHDAAVIARFVAAYEPKYDWKMDPIPGGVYGVRPALVLGIGAEPFAETATRWTFDV